MDNNNNNSSNNNKVEIIGHKGKTKTNKQTERKGPEGRSDVGEESDGDTNTGGRRHECTDEIKKQDNTTNEGKEALGNGIGDVLMVHSNQGIRGTHEEEESEGEWEAIGGLKMIEDIEERPNRSGGNVNSSTSKNREGKEGKNNDLVGPMGLSGEMKMGEQGITKSVKGDGWNVVEVGMDSKEAQKWLSDLSKGKILEAPGNDAVEPSLGQGIMEILGRQAVLRILQDACVTRKTKLKLVEKRTKWICVGPSDGDKIEIITKQKCISYWTRSKL
jgi:hypothetical protein